ncbi:hypothetical protein ACFCV3_35715 [Kribbella sp. NPDC056345]|uniref:hypothetical protein n=1 Tax=Kribbella sp. NPDC056345 TaxID=3345789 RepID=UPI0035DBCEA3
MTGLKRQKPVSRGGVVFFWVMIVLLVVFLGLGGGGGLIKEGLDGRSALADGPSGTFTPTDRFCKKNGCTWIGDFVSREGTITRTGIKLRDDVRVSRTDPMPAEIADVRLHDDAGEPLAYTTDHNWGWTLSKGISLLVLCLTMPVFLIRLLRRHQRQTQSR